MARSPRGATHYCPRRLADDRCAHPVGPHITASLDAQTPGVRTTRFCRPRTSLPGHPEARACSPPKSNRNAVTAPGRSRGSRWLTGVARPATSSRAGAAASIASRLTYRDDRETPFLAGRNSLRFTRRSEFGQSEYWRTDRLTCMWQVLPVGQREGLWVGSIERPTQLQIVTLTSGDGAANHSDGLGLCPSRNDDHGRRDDPTRGHRHVRGRP
ncbi:hypothetical protein ACVWWI_005407 [Bradyrhizobium sp. USDA 3686]